MEVNLNKPTRKSHSRQHHYAFGIQKWLKHHEYCQLNDKPNRLDQQAYKELLTVFATSRPGFKKKGMKNGIHSLEKYVQNRFGEFAEFAHKYLKDDQISGCE